MPVEWTLNKVMSLLMLPKEGVEAKHWKFAKVRMCTTDESAPFHEVRMTC